MSLSKVQLKGVVVGSSNVGKTSLLEQFVHQRFLPFKMPTLSPDLYFKEVQ